MKGTIATKLYRIFFALAVLAVCGSVFAQPVQAATPFITITAVQADTAVTVHATGLPAGNTFMARMDQANTDASSGTVVGQTQAASDGTFDASYAIPSGLHGQAALAIRIDSTSGGWYAYNWFTNRTRGSVPAVTPTPAATSTSASSGAKLYIQVIAVEKNERITVSAQNFPASTDFKVRVGPYATFSTQNASVATINSGNGGKFQFNVDLPDLVKDVSLVTIRMDGYKGGEHLVSYNAFTNADQGTVSSNPSTATPATSTPGPTATTPVAQANCQILSVVPGSSMPTRYDFDAVWEVKNTSTFTWDEHAVDLRYKSGEKLHKFSTPYDLPKRVKPGETVTVRADMQAPDSTGKYTTEFALAGDHGPFCSLPLTITVK